MDRPMDAEEFMTDMARQMDWGATAEEFLTAYRGNRVIAAIAMTVQLMRDHPEEFERGFSLKRATLIACTILDDPGLRPQILERLTVWDDDSYDRSYA